MKKIVKSFPILILVSLLITVLGLVKNIELSKIYGASNDLDVFYLANVYTISVFNIISAAITTVVIPEINNTDSQGNLKNYMFIINGIAFFTSILMVTSFILFPNIIGNFCKELQKLFVTIFLVLIIGQISRIRSAVGIAILQSNTDYILPRITDVLPVALPVLALLLVNTGNLFVIAASIALGYCLQTGILLFYEKSKYSSYLFKSPKVELKKVINPDTKALLLSTIPIIVSSAIFQFQVMLSNYFAGKFGKGIITIFNNTNQIVGVIQAIFILNIVGMFYPSIVKKIKKSVRDGVKETTRIIIITNIIIILVVWGYMAIGQEMIKLLFVRGQFNSFSGDLMYKFGFILIIVLPLDVVRDFCYRIYYSLGDTKKPMINSIQTVILNIVLLICMKPMVGEFSIVFAPAIGTALSMTSILLRMKKDTLLIDIKKIFISYILVNILGFSMYSLLKNINYYSDNLLANLSIKIVIAILFVVICLFIVWMMTRLLRRRNVK